MKLQFLHKYLTRNIKFSVHEARQFLKLWHYHPELELVYIVEGEGTLYAGDFIGDYKKDDIFLIGQNVPHMFHSKNSNEENSISKAYVFHIHEYFLNSSSKYFSEFSFLKQIESISKRGVLFRQVENFQILQILDNIDSESHSENALNVLNILLKLSRYKTYTSLGSLNWLNHYRISEKRVNDAVEFIMLNFKEDITLGKAAEKCGMNKSAFCRYFKKSTGKPFIRFLNEIRISYSCKLLQETSPVKAISEVSYQSGFNSLSYFNRTFRKIHKISPSEYQEMNHSALYNETTE
ncbi:helix-turn-helix domain-containing protein [Salinimicrobium tongyeongense]|uniref:Helix-turn-helix domain-containing protein n=1 Tax=Salinimicrobium tongyeongense TaxID=2809707 RepID=A0ABY6NVU9_9FLAO|nr:AraC family transcriptional regulator [Salinimicrobium tongyeongense]UZH56671.1 helix-turn-helix domain-containing protein [Salinimicrobium tongyeongense]